jgi:hypothetical protein
LWRWSLMPRTEVKNTSSSSLFSSINPIIDMYYKDVEMVT